MDFMRRLAGAENHSAGIGESDQRSGFSADRGDLVESTTNHCIARVRKRAEARNRGAMFRL
ncbi:MAG: hypothetical protein IJI03_05315 [Rudaea sp.]|nr:hypothetical protein [Rudaea sp.]